MIILKVLSFLILSFSPFISLVVSHVYQIIIETRSPCEIVESARKRRKINDIEFLLQLCRVCHLWILAVIHSECEHDRDLHQ